MDRQLNSLPLHQLLQINQICNAFEDAWKAGQQPRAENWLHDVPIELQSITISELRALENEYRNRHDKSLTLSGGSQNVTDGQGDRREEGQGHSFGSQPAVPTQLGDYRLLECIGSGGMGTVYKAVHLRMERIVALKVLRPEVQHDSARLQRFDREVRAAARLTHPHIVAALDAREQQGLRYLITEFVDGCDLEKMVRQQGPLSVDLAIDCILQAAHGLEYAHRLGMVHRDIKPANLLRDARGVVKILDMGLARLETPGVAEPVELTQSGMLMGTAAYMAPEQARDTRRADARSDLYSLGCTLYYLVTGRSMFTGDSMVETILAHVTLPVPLLSESGVIVPEGFEDTFRRMVAKSPEERFQSAAEVIAALEPYRRAVQRSLQVVDGQPVTERLVVNRKNAGTTDATGVTQHSGGKTSPSARISSNATDATHSVPVSTAVAQSPRRKSRRDIVVLGTIGLAILGGVTALALREREDKSDASEFALDFDGESSYVTVPELEPVAGATYTLEAIVEPQEFRTSNIISWMGPDWMALFLTRDGQWGVARRWQGKDFLVAAKTPGRLQVKVHLAGVCEGADLRLFLDGQPIPTDRIKYPLTDTRGGMFIGGADQNHLPEDRFFHGTIYGVRISSGDRYSSGHFKPLNAFLADARTTALFHFPEGKGTQTRSSGSHVWTGEIVKAKWRPLSH